MSELNSNINAEAIRQSRIAQRKQIKRELLCLERQIDRLRRFEGEIDTRTVSTYQEMIESRHQILKSYDNKTSLNLNYSMASM